MALRACAWNGQTMQLRSGADDPFTVAAWWWDNDDLVRPGPAGVCYDTILGMCIANGVNELYFDMHYSRMPAWGETAENKATYEQAAEFIALCGEHGIRVSALTAAGGEVGTSWLDPSRGFPELLTHIENTAAFNRQVQPHERFYGVHFDIEPHYGNERKKVLKWMERMLKTLRAKCDEYGLELEFDLNAWYNAGDLITDEDGNEVNIMELYTTLCDALAIMSYRPTAEMQLGICRFEFDTALKNGCRILLGAETGDPSEMIPEERIISVYPNGTAVFYEEQRKLRRLMEEAGQPPEKCGVAIHWTDTWYLMTQQKP